MGGVRLSSWLGVVLSIFGAGLPARAEAPRTWPVTALLRGGNLYSIRYDPKKTVQGLTEAHLARISMADPAAKAPALVEFRGVGLVEPRNLVRWHLDRNCFWVTSGEIGFSYSIHRVPLGELADLALSMEVNRWDCDPYLQLSDELDKKRRGIGDGFPKVKPDEVVFDVLPTGETSLRMLVVSEKTVRTFDGTGKRDPESKWWQATWKEGEKFDSNFQEPFQLFLQGEDYYFLTRSGRLYRAVKQEKGPRRMVALWVTPGLPVRLVLQDAATGRLFALAPAKKEKPDELVYFELGGRMVFQPYDPKLITPVEKPAGHKQAIEFARFLIAKKLIQPKQDRK